MIAITRSVQTIHGQKFLVDPAWQERLAQIGISEELPWSRLELGQRVSRSSNSSCFRFQLDDGEVVYFKRYVYPPKRWLEFMLRPGKAAVEVWAYAALQQLGIPTLDVVAFGEQRVFGTLVASFIVTREVPYSQDLRRYGSEVWYHLPREERQRIYREIAGKLVEQVRTAHAANFFHHDLKWRNILLQEEGSSLTPVWIDAPRASRMHLRRRRGAVVDLSGLARIAISLLSKYDRMRFVWKYLGDLRKPGDASRLYREVSRHLGRRMPTKNVLCKKK